MAELKWTHREKENDFPEINGWYRVMVSGDSESIDGHTIYSFDDYETWAQFTKHEDGGSFVGEHYEDEHCIFAYCGPIIFPSYNADEADRKNSEPLFYVEGNVIFQRPVSASLSVKSCLASTRPKFAIC